ncbi:molybdopterin-guanine dinucleotide biosynthesis protein B [Sporofaciens musculi]|jgi:molybdopterin-guanine dinucleotide biosynthesis protein B|nr:molybdopterin-guanine dinucleotide biosynthesis protein B [Sporofaciens musculi]MCI9421184.1 molybdopterin-guanine dinucleotide biosynthesis protein B [Dorea sp.]
MGDTAVTEKKRQRLVAVCGVKNSGKTTLLSRLVGELSKEGMKVAVIKHDGHDFTCDACGTDSYRLKEAGAYGTAVFSDFRIFVHKTGFKENEKDLIRMFPEADIIFIEGMKESSYPKIEVIREGISRAPVSNPMGRFLIVTDRDRTEYKEETAGFEEIQRIIEKIRNRRYETDEKREYDERD